MQPNRYAQLESLCLRKLRRSQLAHNDVPVATSPSDDNTPLMCALVMYQIIECTHTRSGANLTTSV